MQTLLADIDNYGEPCLKVPWNFAALLKFGVLYSVSLLSPGTLKSTTQEVLSESLGRKLKYCHCLLLPQT